MSPHPLLPYMQKRRWKCCGGWVGWSVCTGDVWSFKCVVKVAECEHEYNKKSRTIWPRPLGSQKEKCPVLRDTCTFTLNSRRAHHPPNTHQCRNHVLWGVLLWFNVIHFWLPLFSLKASCLTSDPSVCVKGRKVWPLCWWEKAAQWVGWKLGHQADVGGECASFLKI